LLTKANKSWENSYFSYNIFLGHFCPKSAAVRAPNFPGQSVFYSAGFVLFGRIFSLLATVSVGPLPLPPTTPSATVASRPKILQNNSKPAVEKNDWPEKFGGRKAGEFWQKRSVVVYASFQTHH
jgi:hypothetical protein